VKEIALMADDEVPGQVLRRAPFSDNPDVGARGQRTQQRIVEAALVVFGEQGYHQTSVDRITRVAGCSRVSFYQYFSSKEDLFRYLSGQVARQLNASAEALGTVTPDLDGWATLRAWVGRHADIYERYEPVFHAFAAAAETDAAVAGGADRTGQRHLERVRSRLAVSEFPARQLNPVVRLLISSLTRTTDTVGILRAAAPHRYPADRVADAFTDLFHRCLFGPMPDVNVHLRAGRRPPVLAFSRDIRAISREAGGADRTPAGQRTFDALLEAGEDVFVRRGFHRTRVDDIVEVAGVSHGAFYRYFDNKDQLAHVVAFRAMQGISRTLRDLPDAYPGALPNDGSTKGPAALRSWLRRYTQANADASAMVRIWADATRRDTTLRTESAAAIDWGRRRLADFLRPRGFGDPDTDAVLMVAMLSALGSPERSLATVDAAARVIECGFLGRAHPQTSRRRRPSQHPKCSG
jgi:AcrR family transcriptional regulator